MESSEYILGVSDIKILFSKYTLLWTSVGEARLLCEVWAEGGMGVFPLSCVRHQCSAGGPSKLGTHRSRLSPSSYPAKDHRNGGKVDGGEKNRDRARPAHRNYRKGKQKTSGCSLSRLSIAAESGSTWSCS